MLYRTSVFNLSKQKTTTITTTKTIKKSKTLRKRKNLSKEVEPCRFKKQTQHHTENSSHRYYFSQNIENHRRNVGQKEFKKRKRRNYLKIIQIRCLLRLLNQATSAEHVKLISMLIIKITISSIVIGFKKLLFPTNSLAKLLSDSLLSDSLLSDSLLIIGQFKKPITCKVVV